MKRFLLWLCSRGMHRGDVTILLSGMTLVDCRTCNSPVFYKWGRDDAHRGTVPCPYCLTVDGTRRCRH